MRSPVLDDYDTLTAISFGISHLVCCPRPAWTVFSISMGLTLGRKRKSGKQKVEIRPTEGGEIGLGSVLRCRRKSKAVGPFQLMQAVRRQFRVIKAHFR